VSFRYLAGVIERTVTGDVTAYRLSWWRSRLIGFHVHVFVARQAMIDTGFPGAQHALEQIVGKEHVRGAFITHHHEDHAGNVPWLAEHGVPMTMDAERGVPMTMDARTEHAVRAPEPIGMYRRVTWQSMRALAHPVTPFDADGFQLVPAPGHSPDHHVVWDAETGTLFAGDLFLGVRLKVGHWYDDPRAHVRALHTCIARSPERVFCAHRGLLREGVRLLALKAEWLETLIARVEALAGEGLDHATIRARALGTRGMTHWASFGDYSPDHIVRAILRPIESSPSSLPGPHAHR
jgi:glyoxylase-like metal-dependent hydrolase (beta-lactamase superfamily II)